MQHYHNNESGIRSFAWCETTFGFAAVNLGFGMQRFLARALDGSLDACLAAGFEVKLGARI